MPTEFTPFSALFGGALIGVSASMLLLFHGRVAGISGIVGGLFTPRAGDVGWRAAFVGGMLVAGLGSLVWKPEMMAVVVDRPLWTTVVAGLLVGFGTRLGSGCTSGHGVCGLSRLSPRSLASVMTFMAVGMLVASVVGAMLRGDA